MSSFKNPILTGCHPDPSICRVGDDYYLVTSSFHYYPGIPIFHSRDLVHWRQIGHVLDRPEQVNFEGIEPSGGVFAPTLRYHEGVFYVVTTIVSGGGNVVMTATDPAGPWSNPIPIKGAPGIDPSFFFDSDGRCYITGNGDPEVSLYDGHHTIWLAELDTKEWKVLNPPKVIVNGGSDIRQKPIWIEGPHIYKIDGLYYLIAAEGGTAEWHSVVAFRSDNVWGPYEPCPANPISTNRDQPEDTLNPITCTGHADLVLTQNGEWWMVMLGCRPYAPFAENHYNIGRETFLVPLTWSDGWPVAGDGRIHHTYTAPDLPAAPQGFDYAAYNVHLIDAFDDPQLRPEWNTIRTSCRDWYSLTERPGYLRIRPQEDEIYSLGNPGFVGVRQRNLNFTAETALEYLPGSLNSGAGMTVLQNARTFFAMESGLDGNQRVLRLLRKATMDLSEPETLLQVPLSGDKLSLRIAARGAYYDFFYREDEGDWINLAAGQDGRILSTRTAGGFVGVYVGLYATSRDAQEDGGIADFASFEYHGQDGY